MVYQTLLPEKALGSRGAIDFTPLTGTAIELSARQ